MCDEMSSGKYCLGYTRKSYIKRYKSKKVNLHV